MAYRLADRFTEPELVAWVDRQGVYSDWIGMWLGGIATGLIVGFALGFLW